MRWVNGNLKPTEKSSDESKKFTNACEGLHHPPLPLVLSRTNLPYPAETLFNRRERCCRERESDVVREVVSEARAIDGSNSRIHQLLVHVLGATVPVQVI